MKIFLFFVVLSFQSFAHEYHFAFAEAEYNTESKTVQATITVSTRDFQHSLEHEGFVVEPLENYKDDQMMQFSLANKLLEHFKISFSQVNCEFNYTGYEVLNNGTTNFYFESQKLEISSDITFVFDLMMDSNPKQQNKLTFIYLNEKKTLEFLPNQTTQNIKLETILE